ncbi:MAG: hypothetical protein JST26_13040 [Bacteroidetes bacterium]|nr:hypothetical protein [Bacteroidota bacterium]
MPTFDFQVVFMAKDWQFRYKNAKKSELLKEFEGWDKEDLINHIMELRGVIRDMESDLGDGGSNRDQQAAPKTFSEANYRQVWSYPTKIAFLITMLQKPLTSEEIHQHLLKLDSHYKDYKVPRNNLTVTINRTLKSGRVKKVKVPGIRSLYYVLPEWLDKEGLLKEFYQCQIMQFE